MGLFCNPTQGVEGGIAFRWPLQWPSPWEPFSALVSAKDTAPTDYPRASVLQVANAVSEKGTYKQIPGCFNFLRKKLFFKTS